jgi:hypothetical protein
MDAPEEQVGDVALAAALRVRGRRIQLQAIGGGVAYAVGICLSW